MFQTLDVSTSGLIAQRHRMNTIAGNIANINTTRNAANEPEPFQRRLVQFTALDRDSEGRPVTGGAKVAFEVLPDESNQPRKVQIPGHPDADASGNVLLPDINLTTEFVNALEASRAYEANVAAVEVTKSMLSQTLRILG